MLTCPSVGSRLVVLARFPEDPPVDRAQVRQVVASMNRRLPEQDQRRVGDLPSDLDRVARVVGITLDQPSPPE